MNLQTSTKDIEINEELAELIQKKLTSKLIKFFKNKKGTTSAKLLITKDPRWGFNAKLEIKSPGEKPFSVKTKHKHLVYAIVSLCKEASSVLRRRKSKY